MRFVKLTASHGNKDTFYVNPKAIKMILPNTNTGVGSLVRIFDQVGDSEVMETPAEIVQQASKYLRQNAVLDRLKKLAKSEVDDELK